MNKDSRDNRYNYTEEGKMSVSIRLGSEKVLCEIISGQRTELWIPANSDNMDKYTDEYALQGSGRVITDFVTNDGDHWGARTLKDIGEVRVYVIASSKRLWAKVRVKKMTYEGRSNRFTGNQVKPFIIIHLGPVSDHN